MEHQDLNDLDVRADRMLDGMSVNRDKLARDIKTLTQELRNWRATFDRTKRESGNASGFGSAFDELLRRGARRG